MFLRKDTILPGQPPDPAAACVSLAGPATVPPPLMRPACVFECPWCVLRAGSGAHGGGVSQGGGGGAGAVPLWRRPPSLCSPLHGPGHALLLWRCVPAIRVTGSEVGLGLLGLQLGLLEHTSTRQRCRRIALSREH